MQKILSLSDLNSIKDEALPRLRTRLDGDIAHFANAQELSVTICRSTGCTATGSDKVEKAFIEQLSKSPLSDKVKVIRSGCRGFCEKGPTVLINPGDIFYVKVTADDVAEIIERTLRKRQIVERLVIKDSQGKAATTLGEVPFYKGQVKRVLGLNGLINSLDIQEYMACDGYQAFAKALGEMSPDLVIKELAQANLRGRGGAGFPTATKWTFVRKAVSDTKYIVCNGDEGDPGAFMNRSVLEDNPHSIIEGMLIGAYAIGNVRQGIAYIRAEYPLAIETLGHAIKQAREYGLLGKNIFNTGFDFDLEILPGAGAFVCGEETALLASIEGKRGTPRPRPPLLIMSKPGPRFPSSSGMGRNGLPA
jgi:(2Fe-2S) ferredoxin